jgi:hypothetical protein
MIDLVESAPNQPQSGKGLNRYSRFLHVISLTLKNVTERGLFQDVPVQVKKKKKNGDGDWCNLICFGGEIVYFYSRVVGSRGCPKSKAGEGEN